MAIFYCHSIHGLLVEEVEEPGDDVFHEAGVVLHGQEVEGDPAGPEQGEDPPGLAVYPQGPGQASLPALPTRKEVDQGELQEGGEDEESGHEEPDVDELEVGDVGDLENIIKNVVIDNTEETEEVE